jgi:replicative DNA helicase
MGRSCFALGIANFVSKYNAGTVAIVTPQESEKEVAVRLLRIGMGTEASKLLDGSMSPEDAADACRDFLMSRRGKIKNIRPSYLTLAEIQGWAESYPDLRLLIVDNIEYIHKPILSIPDDGKVFKPERVPMPKLIHCLKRLAQILDVPVICTASLHRSLENRKNKRPRLKDLEKINVPVELVDQVAFLYRDGYYYEHSKRDAAECIIAKSSNGQTGTVHLEWYPETGEFRNLENS